MKNKKEAYMNGHPTRLEVANYVNALLEEHYLPHIQGLIQLSSMVLQAILIRKNVCTGEELKEITELFIKEQQRRFESLNKLESDDCLKEVLDKKYINMLKTHLENVNKGVYAFQSLNHQMIIAKHLSEAINALEEIVNGTHAVTDKDRENILNNLIEDKQQLENEQIVLKKKEDTILVIGVLWDAIIPFSQKKLINGIPTDKKDTSK